MEERQSLYDLAHRYRKNCRICGAPVGYEEASSTDDLTTVHLECWFDLQAKEGA